MDDKGCTKEIFDLLRRNEISEAIGILEQRIQENKKLTDLYSTLITSHAFYNRVEKHFMLGLISWDDYNLSNSKIIESAINLAENVCGYLAIVRQRELERKALAEKRVLWLEWQNNERIWREQHAWIKVLNPDESQQWVKWFERKFPDKNKAIHRQKNSIIQDLDLLLDSLKMKHRQAIEKIEKGIQSWRNWQKKQEETSTHISEVQKNDIQDKVTSEKKRIERIETLQTRSLEWFTRLNPEKQQEWMIAAEILEPFELIELEEMLEQLPEEKRQSVLEFLDFSDPFKGRPKEVQWNNLWEEIVTNDDYDYDDDSNTLHSPSYISPIKSLVESFHTFFKELDSLQSQS